MTIMETLSCVTDSEGVALIGLVGGLLTGPAMFLWLLIYSATSRHDLGSTAVLGPLVGGISGTGLGVTLGAVAGAICGFFGIPFRDRRRCLLFAVALMGFVGFLTALGDYLQNPYRFGTWPLMILGMDMISPVLAGLAAGSLVGTFSRSPSVQKETSNSRGMITAVPGEMAQSTVSESSLRGSFFLLCVVVGFGLIAIGSWWKLRSSSSEDPLSRAVQMSHGDLLAAIRTVAVRIEVDDRNEVISLDLNRKNIADDGVQLLARLTSLEWLDLSGNRISDDGIVSLRRLSKLRHLNVGFCDRSPHDEFFQERISDAGIAELRGLTELRELNLTLSSITDAGLRTIGRFDRLESLVLQQNRGITDASLKHLANLRRLKRLDLAQCYDFGDDGVANLAGLSNLEWMDLSGSQISDSGLKNLVAMRHLRHLNLAFCKRINVDGLRHLKYLPDLEELVLESTNVHDAGLVNLQGMRSLMSLNLDGTPITDAGLADLKQLPALKKLGLYGNVFTHGIPNGHHRCRFGSFTGAPALEELNLGLKPLTDSGLIQLGRLTGLSKLGLAETKITDGGLSRLGGLAHLRDLDLGSTSVTGKGLDALAHLGKLEHLGLNFCKGVTDDSLTSIARLRGLKWLDLSGTNVTDAGLDRLAVLTNLETLYLPTSPAVTPQEVETLRRALPKCKIDN